MNHGPYNRDNLLSVPACKELRQQKVNKIFFKCSYARKQYECLVYTVDKNEHWSVSLLSNSSVSALIGNLGPSDNMIGLSFNMAATWHTRFKTKEYSNIYVC